MHADLRELTKGHENFAYLCRFDRGSRLNGNETLFLSDREPLLAFENVGGLIEEASGLMPEGGQIPFFVTYDAVTEFYPVGGIKRSGWPMAAAMVPDSVMHGKYARTGESSSRRIADNAPADQDALARVTELRQRIIEGELLQVVLSRRFDVHGIDPFSLLNYFMERDRSLFVYYYRFGEYEIIGSSPENVVTRSGKDLEIHPIAGTTRRGIDDEEDAALQREMMSSPKELREHRMLVDLARNDLGIISEPGSVKVVRSMEIQKFASVQHIVSTVHSVLREGLGNYDIIRTAFPAGTVSGAPKVRAIRLIDLYEETPRGPYGGGLGVMSENSLEMALMIRSLFRSSAGSYTQAGGGIVMDSDPVAEVREVHSKAATVMGGVAAESIDR